MWPVKKVLRSFLIAVGIYVLLTLPWPPVRAAYRYVFRVAISSLFGHFGSEGVVQVILPTDKDRANPNFRPNLEDLVVVLERRSVSWEETRGQDGKIRRVPVTDVAALRMAIESGRVGYVPMAELIALVLATPISWSRKWRALAWGLLLVNLFVVFRFALLLCFSYYGVDSALRLDNPGPFWNKVLALSHEFFFVSPTCTVLAPAFVWGLVALRRDDITRLMATAGKDQAKRAQTAQSGNQE